MGDGVHPVRPRRGAGGHRTLVLQGRRAGAGRHRLRPRPRPVPGGHGKGSRSCPIPFLPFSISNTIYLQHHFHYYYYLYYLHTYTIYIYLFLYILTSLTPHLLTVVTTARRADFELIHRYRRIMAYMDFVVLREDYVLLKPDSLVVSPGLQRFASTQTQRCLYTPTSLAAGITALSWTTRSPATGLLPARYRSALPASTYSYRSTSAAAGTGAHGVLTLPSRSPARCLRGRRSASGPPPRRAADRRPPTSWPAVRRPGRPAPRARRGSGRAAGDGPSP